MWFRLACAVSLCLVFGGWSFAASADQCSPLEASTLAAVSADGDAEAAQETEAGDTDTEQDGEWYTETHCVAQGCAQGGAIAPLGLLFFSLGSLGLVRRIRSAQTP